LVTGVDKVSDEYKKHQHEAHLRHEIANGFKKFDGILEYMEESNCQCLKENHSV